MVLVVSAVVFQGFAALRGQIPDAAAHIDSLLLRAQAEGPVRIIVGLAGPAALEAPLANAAIAAQRAQISVSQDLVSFRRSLWRSRRQHESTKSFRLSHWRPTPPRSISCAACPRSQAFARTRCSTPLSRRALPLSARRPHGRERRLGADGPSRSWSTRRAKKGSLVSYWQGRVGGLLFTPGQLPGRRDLQPGTRLG